MMAARLDEAADGSAESRVVAERNCPDAVVSTDFRGALSVVASLIMALVDVISMKIFCHVCVFY